MWSEIIVASISFRRSLETANKCKVGVMEAYDVYLNHAFDQNDSEHWWWESERSKADSGSFYLLKGWSDPN